MRYVMRMLGVAATGEMFDPLWPQYLRSYDISTEGFDIVLTLDPTEAMRFLTKADAMRAWRMDDNVRPVRPDGEPNRPMTAFHVEILPRPMDEDLEADEAHVQAYNEVERFCPACGEDMIGNDPHAPDCPTTVVDSEQLGVCVDCGETCSIHMRRCTWCAALKHLA